MRLHSRHWSFYPTTFTQRVTQHITWLTIIATVSQPLLPVLLLDLHIYPFSVFCFITSMSTGGRRYATRLWSGREDSTTKIFAPRQWWLSFFFFLPLRRSTKTFPSEGVFWNCFMQMGGLQRCFLSRGYHGLARVHERKKRFPNRRLR